MRILPNFSSHDFQSTTIFIQIFGATKILKFIQPHPRFGEFFFFSNSNVSPWLTIESMFSFSHYFVSPRLFRLPLFFIFSPSFPYCCFFGFLGECVFCCSYFPFFLLQYLYMISVDFCSFDTSHLSFGVGVPLLLFLVDFLLTTTIITNNYNYRYKDIWKQRWKSRWKLRLKFLRQVLLIMSNRSIVLGQVSPNITHTNNMYEDISSCNNTLMLVSRILYVTINDDVFDNNDCICDNMMIKLTQSISLILLTNKILNKMFINIIQSRIYILIMIEIVTAIMIKIKQSNITFEVWYIYDDANAWSPKDKL